MKGISFSASGQFGRVFLDYVSGAERMKPFYPFAPGEAGLREAIDALRYEESMRPVLLAALRRQYESSGLQAPEQFVTALENGACTITTGHQLCLFTGPLYFIVKIASVIRLAREAEAISGKSVIPVYWMASEDHDFEEIASVQLFGKKLSWEKTTGGPVGKLSVDSLAGMLHEIKTLMGESPAAKKLSRIFEEAYRPGRNLAQATRELVHRLFDGKVLVIDGDDPELKKSFVSFFRKDIFTHEPFRLVNETISRLGEAQVNPREINVFYTGENFRERIVEENENYRVLNTELLFTKEALEQKLQDEPARFSPNVVLRPLYQQWILPNIAYVGGPGEIAYWLQYKSMFDTLGVFFPLLQPRNFFLLVDPAARKKMEKLALSTADFFNDPEALIRQQVTRQSGDSLDLAAEKENITAAFSGIISKAESADATLRKAAEAELQKALNGVEALQGKMIKAMKQKQETGIGQIRKLHEQFFPGGVLQERAMNFIPFWIQSEGKLIDRFVESCSFPVEGISFFEL